MVIRELIAKLGFKVDDKQAKKFEKTIKGLQVALASFAVGKFDAAMSQMDDAMENTRRQIALVAGDKGVGLLEDALGSRVVSSANEMATAISNSLTSLTDPKFTRDTIQFSEKLATALGKSVVDIQGAFDQAALSKSFEPLKALGLVTQNQIEIMQRAGIEYSTANMKMAISNSLMKKGTSINKLYNDSLHKSSAEKRKFWKNLNDIGMLIGKTINPIIAKLASALSSVMEFFLNNKIGQFIIKVGALGSLFAVLVGAVASVVAVFSAIGAVLGAAFIVILKISAAVAAVVLIFEDLWKTFEDPTADTWFRDMINMAKELGDWIAGIGESFKNMFNFEAPDWWKNSLGKLKVFEGTGAITQLQNQGNGSQQTNIDRKAEINIVVNGTPEVGQVQSETVAALKEMDFTASAAQIPAPIRHGGR